MKIQKTMMATVHGSDFLMMLMLCHGSSDDEDDDDGNSDDDGGSRDGSPYVARVFGFPGSQQCPLQSKSVKIPLDSSSFIISLL